MRARNEKLKLVNWVAVCRGTMVDEEGDGDSTVNVNRWIIWRLSKISTL
jgi:hypothetical protein